MEFSAADITTWCGGRIEGPHQAFTGMATLEDAEAGTLSFAGHARYAKEIKDSQAAGVLCSEGLPVQRRAEQTIIWVGNADLAVAQVLEHLQIPPEIPAEGIHPTAVVDPSAQLGARARVGPHVVIGKNAVIGAGAVLMAQDYIGAGAHIGAECLIYPLVMIADRCRVGDRVILHGGCVIGADGFGYRFAQGRHVKIPHIGTVEIGADCELGANTTVDRGKFAATVVGAGSKLDNLVQIAHNVRLGRHSIMAGQSGIAGSAQVGEYLVMGGASVISDHVRVGSRVQVAGMSAVATTTGDDEKVGGIPAHPVREMIASIRANRQLPKLLETIQELKTRIAKLESAAEEHRQ